MVSTGQAHAATLGLAHCVARTLGSFRKPSLHASCISTDPLFCFRKGRCVLWSQGLEVVLGNVSGEPSCWCWYRPMSRSSGLRQWLWSLEDFVPAVWGTQQRTNRDSMTIEIGRELAATTVGRTDPVCAPLLPEKAGSSRAGNGLLEGSFLSLGS